MKFGDTDDKVDIPTWYQGDAWSYTANITFDSDTIFFDGTVTDLSLQVNGLATISIEDKTFLVYKTELSGDITGLLKLFTESMAFQFPIWGEIEGYSYSRVSDLSLVKTEISLVGFTQVGGAVTIWIFDIVEGTRIAFDMELEVMFRPPVENYDFPLEIGETWLTSSSMNLSATLSFAAGRYVETMSVEFSEEGNMTCVEKDTLVVPAGIFPSYILSTPDIRNNSLWYVPEVKNVGRIYVQYEDGNDTLFVDSVLTSFHHSNSQTIQVEEYLDPPLQIPGQELVVHGKVTNTETNNPVRGGIVTVIIPAVEKNWTTTTDEAGYYSLSLPAPNISDHTPSSCDMGSDGVIVTCTSDGETGYRVQTFASKEDTMKPDVRINSPREGYLYIQNKEVCRFFTGCVVGMVDIDVSARDNETDIKQVMLYVGDTLLATFEDPPYIWTWDEKLWGEYTIKVVAYDSFGNHASDEIQVFKFL